MSHFWIAQPEFGKAAGSPLKFLCVNCKQTILWTGSGVPDSDTKIFVKDKNGPELTCNEIIMKHVHDS